MEFKKSKRNKKICLSFIFLLLLVNYFTFTTISYKNISVAPSGPIIGPIIDSQLDPQIDTQEIHLQLVHSSTVLHHFIHQRNFLPFIKNKLYDDDELFNLKLFKIGRLQSKSLSQIFSFNSINTSSSVFSLSCMVLYFLSLFVAFSNYSLSKYSKILSFGMSMFFIKIIYTRISFFCCKYDPLRGMFDILVVGYLYLLSYHFLTFPVTEFGRNVV